MDELDVSKCDFSQEKKSKRKKYKRRSSIEKYVDEKIEESFKLHRKHLDSVKKAIEKILNNHHKELQQFGRLVSLRIREMDEQYKKVLGKMEIMEETFLTIYHNIKRNQFLYAHYPEEWNATFLEMKKNMRKENDELENLEES